MIFKAALASQRWPFCPYKPLNFQTLRHLQFLSNFLSPKFKFSVSGKKNVRLFDAMTKTSGLSEKNVPLHAGRLQSVGPGRESHVLEEDSFGRSYVSHE